ncbi:hypothetical protein PP707_07600 [Acetobacter pasteurianus]|nr:hypothetical protein [Acetobacter pasteurianus]
MTFINMPKQSANSKKHLKTKSDKLSNNNNNSSSSSGGNSSGNNSMRKTTIHSCTTKESPVLSSKVNYILKTRTLNLPHL